MWPRRCHWLRRLRWTGSSAASSAAVMGGANRHRFSRAAGPGYSWRWPSGCQRVAVQARTGPSISHGAPHAGQAMARGGLRPTARARWAYVALMVSSTMAMSASSSQARESAHTPASQAHSVAQDSSRGWGCAARVSGSMASQMTLEASPARARSMGGSHPGEGRMSRRDTSRGGRDPGTWRARMDSPSGLRVPSRECSSVTRSGICWMRPSGSVAGIHVRSLVTGPLRWLRG